MEVQSAAPASALAVVSDYVAAIAARDRDAMDRLRARAVCERRTPPTGRKIRSVPVCNVSDGLIRREMMFFDLATLLAEPGIES